MAKDWTPGPWEIIDYYGWPVSIGSPEHTKRVCDLPQEQTVTDKANARLIAAAPELFEALSELRKWMPPASDERIKAACDMADNVLRKATGEDV